MISHTAFFGDGTYVFAFPSKELIEELERKTGVGIGGLFRRFRTSDYSLADVLNVIRIGLVGGGLNPKRADELVNLYAVGQPLADVFAVADGVIAALFFGSEEPTPEPSETPSLIPVEEGSALHDQLADKMAAAASKAIKQVAA